MTSSMASAASSSTPIKNPMVLSNSLSLFLHALVSFSVRISMPLAQNKDKQFLYPSLPFTEKMEQFMIDTSLLKKKTTFLFHVQSVFFPQLEHHYEKLF